MTLSRRVRGWWGCVVGPEVVFGEVERAVDRGAVPGIRSGGPGNPTLHRLGVDTDNVRELLRSHPSSSAGRS